MQTPFSEQSSSTMQPPAAAEDAAKPPESTEAAAVAVATLNRNRYIPVGVSLNSFEIQPFSFFFNFRMCGRVCNIGEVHYLCAASFVGF